MACGVAVFIMLRSMHGYLQQIHSMVSWLFNTLRAAERYVAVIDAAHAELSGQLTDAVDLVDETVELLLDRVLVGARGRRKHEARSTGVPTPTSRSRSRRSWGT